MLHVETDGFDRRAVHIGKTDKRCAATQGFDAHRTGAREQVPPVGIDHIPAQDVEERLLGAVGDRSCRVARNRLQLAAFGFAGNDSETHEVQPSTIFLAARMLPWGAMMGTTHPVARMNRFPPVCCMAFHASSWTSV